MKISFTKMQGNGNDFIVIDNRKSLVKDKEISNLVQKVCKRHYHIGADGVIFLEDYHDQEVNMRYFNADGSEGEMCGNGARCLALFAYEKGIANDHIFINTVSGKYEAKIVANHLVQINFPNIFIEKVKRIFLERERLHVYSLIVGVPHVVFFKDNIHEINSTMYEKLAKKIRYNKEVFPHGTNVNMVEIVNEHKLAIRTYERGVEEETEACGTGSIAASIVSASLQKVSSPVRVVAKGGDLLIKYNRNAKRFEQISLTGKAEIVFEGNFYYVCK